MPSWGHLWSSAGVHCSTDCKDKFMMTHTSFGVLQTVCLCMFGCVHVCLQVCRYVGTGMCLHVEARVEIDGRCLSESCLLVSWTFLRQGLSENLDPSI